MICEILFELPTKEPLRWASDYKRPTQCCICYGTERLCGWPRIMCKEPPPWTCVCFDCVISWREGGGETVEELRATRMKKRGEA